MKNRKHTYGIGLIFMSCILSINPYTLFYIIPIFLVGIALLWSSEIHVQSKLTFTVIPFLLVLIFYLGLIYQIDFFIADSRTV